MNVLSQTLPHRSCSIFLFFHSLPFQPFSSHPPFIFPPLISQHGAWKRPTVALKRRTSSTRRATPNQVDSWNTPVGEPPTRCTIDQLEAKRRWKVTSEVRDRRRATLKPNTVRRGSVSCAKPKSVPRKKAVERGNTPLEESDRERTGKEKRELKERKRKKETDNGE